MNKEYLVKAIDREKLIERGFSDSDKFKRLNDGTKCKMVMSKVLPDTFRHTYELFVVPDVILGGVVYLRGGPEFMAIDELLDKISFRAPEAAAAARALVEELIESGAITVEEVSK